MKLNVIKNQTFTNANGRLVTVDKISDNADGYFENDDCMGIRLNYEGDYSFIALLPKKDKALDEFINDFDATDYFALSENETFSSRNEFEIKFRMPRFETESDLQLDSALKEMGLVTAFDPSLADLTGLGKSIAGDNLYISKVMQKAKISLDEFGTVAAASSGIFETPESESNKIKLVDFNKPFVYFIVDDTTNLPIFIGTVESV